MQYSASIKRVLGFFITPAFTGILLAVIITVLIAGVYTGHQQGVTAAKAMIYDTLWFDFLWALLGVNLAGNVIRFRLYKPAYLPLLIFHLGVLVVLAGAAVTRYAGVQGRMKLGEGERKSHFLTRDNYLRIEGYSDKDTVSRSRRVYLTDHAPGLRKRLRIGGKTFAVHVQDFLENAVAHFVSDRRGKPAVQIAAHRNRDVQEAMIQAGDYARLHERLVAFNRSMPNAIKLSYRSGNVFFTAKDTVVVVNPALNSEKTIPPGETYLFRSHEVLEWKGIELVLMKMHRKARIVYANQPERTAMTGRKVLRLQLENSGDRKKVYVPLKRNAAKQMKDFRFNGVHFRIGLGGREVPMPFAIRLADFDMQSHQTPDKPANYKSTLRFYGDNDTISGTYQIYSKDFLRYRGYRIYQSSYDFDEQKSILAITHDAPGRWITYAGILVFVIGAVISLFYRSSRFRWLWKHTSATRAGKTLLVLVLLFACTSGLKAGDELPEKHVDAFGKVLVKGQEGRVKPMAILAYQLIRDFTGREYFRGQRPEALVLEMMIHPEASQADSILHIENKQLREVLQMKGRYISFEGLFDEEGAYNYRLNQYVETAYIKSPGKRDAFDRAVIETDEKVNLLSLVYTGHYFRMFPEAGSGEWDSPQLMQQPELPDSSLKSTFYAYLNRMDTAQTSTHYSQAFGVLQRFSGQQRAAVSEDLPSPAKVNLEIWYSRTRVFLWLSLLYAIAGLLAFGAGFWYFYRQPYWLQRTCRWLKIALIVIFGLHILALFVRGYLAGHLPWASDYEALLFAGLAGMLAGLILVRKSPVFLGIAGMSAAVLLFAAHFHFLNPDIFLLPDAFRSPWLAAHKAVSTASYAFLGISAIGGGISLMLMMFRVPFLRSALNEILQHIKQASEINLTLGLYLLFSGILLGIIWSSEARGSFWAWEPRQAWSLITLVIYVFVTHMRLIPGFKGIYGFNLGTAIAYGFVLMTFFGFSRVNSFIRHAPDAPVSLEWILILSGVAVVAIGALLNENKLGTKTDRP